MRRECVASSHKRKSRTEANARTAFIADYIVLAGLSVTMPTGQNAAISVQLERDLLPDWMIFAVEQCNQCIDSRCGT